MHKQVILIAYTSAPAVMSPANPQVGKLRKLESLAQW